MSRIRVGGGGARSAVWREIQAGAYRHPVEALAAEEGAAYGAAILAGVGAGLWASVDDACDAIVRPASVTRADPAIESALAESYTRFGRIYPALRMIFGPQAP